MRWATAEDFTELKVMPRMLLDHFPDNIHKTLTKILEDQKPTSGSVMSVHHL
jgi:sn1-specific diacylglycerol lipase